MGKYVTSGGELGGTEVDVPEDEVGTKVQLDWTSPYKRAWKLNYELREHDPETGEMALIYVGRERG